MATVYYQSEQLTPPMPTEKARPCCVSAVIAIKLPPDRRHSLPARRAATANTPSRRAPPPQTPYSRPAQPQTTPASAPASILSAAHHFTIAEAELARYTQIVRRLKWKLPYLASAYLLAATPISPFAEGLTCTEQILARRQQIAEANLMFKLDFFDYYMFLERAVVHLLGVFGANVSRYGLQGSRHAHSEQVRAFRGERPHQYHANVLMALESERCPLHDALGTGDAKEALQRAKDLRNRWKNADDDLDELGNVAKTTGAVPLAEYDLERILEVIFTGFDKGFLLAEKYVLGMKAERCAQAAGTSGTPVQNPLYYQQPSEDDESQWEFMVDAMDWEAV